MESPNPYLPPPASLGVQHNSANFNPDLTANEQSPDSLDPRRDTPDPGTPLSRTIALVLVIVLVGAVMILQQLGNATPPPNNEPIKVKAPVGFSPFESQAYAYLRYWGFVLSFAPSQSGGSQPSFVGNLEDGRKQILEGIDNVAVTELDRYRAALATALVSGNQDARSRLVALNKELTAQQNAPSAGGSSSTPPRGASVYEGLDTDVSIAINVIDNGPDSISSEQRTSLIERHGYFAKLLLVSDQPENSAERQDLTAGGGKMVLLILLLVGFLFLVAIASITCFIIAWIRLADGRIKPKFRAPMPGGGIFLESLAVFAAAFLALKVGMELLTGGTGGPGGASAPTVIAVAVSMALQWALLLVVFWPRLRGVPMPELARRIGWTKGEGVVKEIGAGMFAYFATLPFIFVVVIIMAIVAVAYAIMQHGSSKAVQPPENPLIEALSSGNLFVLGLLFVLATVWAPFVEESLFRGGLFRHVRSRVGVLLAALISTIAFGVMHNYPWMLLAPVMTLGFNFALMREWRNSLIAPMFAHSMHNGTVLLIAYTAINTLSVPAVS